MLDRLAMLFVLALWLPSQLHAAEIAVSINSPEAIADAINRAQPGDTVSLPAGTCSISETISLKPAITLNGAGQEKTILAFNGQSGCAMLNVSGADGAVVRNLTLDGQSNPNAQQGITGSRASKIRIHNVTIRNLVKGTGFGPHGILFSGQNPTREGGVTDSEISECRFENIGVEASFGCAIRFSWGSSRNRAVGNTILNTGRGGIFADNGSTDIIVCRNTIKGSGGEGLGIEVWGGCDRSVIEDNQIDHWLSIGGCDYCAARRNTVSDKSGEYKFCGIEVIGSGNVVTGNTVDGGQKIGISVSSTQPKKYTFYGRNNVRACNQWGSQFQGEAGGISCHYFYRCSFTEQPLDTGPVWYPGDEGNGFRFNGNCRRMTFEECTFSNNGRLGIQFVGKNIDLLDFARCSIRDNAGPATSLLDGYTGLEWNECTVSGNASDTLSPAKPLPGKSFTAAFDSPSNGTKEASLSFANTTAGFGPGWTALWDFDDGPPVAQHDSGASPLVHTYTTPGHYRVTLIVWDDLAHASRAEQIVHITK